MSRCKPFLWAILFLCIALSCSDDEGGSSYTAGPGSDRRFDVFTEDFLRFLQSKPNTFTTGTSGLTFADPQLCQETASLQLSISQYELSSTACQYSIVDDNDIGNEQFFIINSVRLSTGITIYASVSFLDSGIPQTGTYANERVCNFFCSFKIAARIYVVAPDNELIDFYYGNPQYVTVVNNGNLVMAAFSAEYVSEFTEEVVTGASTLVCCN